MQLDADDAVGADGLGLGADVLEGVGAGLVDELRHRVDLAARQAAEPRADALADRHQACRLLVELVGGVRKLPSKLAGVSAVEGINEAGSFQREVEHRLECVVENGIAGMVREVCHQNAHWGVGHFL